MTFRGLIDQEAYDGFSITPGSRSGLGVRFRAGAGRLKVDPHPALRDLAVQRSEDMALLIAARLR